MALKIMWAPRTKRDFSETCNQVRGKNITQTEDNTSHSDTSLTSSYGIRIRQFIEKDLHRPSNESPSPQLLFKSIFSKQDQAGDEAQGSAHLKPHSSCARPLGVLTNIFSDLQDDIQIRAYAQSWQAKMRRNYKPSTSTDTDTALHALRQETPAQVVGWWETTASQYFLLHLSNKQESIVAPDLFPMLLKLNSDSRKEMFPSTIQMHVALLPGVAVRLLSKSISPREEQAAQKH